MALPESRERALSLGADGFCCKPVPRDWLLAALRGHAAIPPVKRALIVDDLESARYLIRQQLLTLERYAVIEAANGVEGLRMARKEWPDVIFLDLVLPDMSGFDVLDQLKADPATAKIPVIINTSTDIDESDRKRLAAEAAAVLSKEAVGPHEGLAQIREALATAGLEPPPDDLGVVRNG